MPLRCAPPDAWHVMPGTMRRGAIGPHRSPTTRHASFVAAQMRPDLERDGQGLTELEFVLAMLIELEIVEWGKVAAA